MSRTECPASSPAHICLSQRQHSNGIFSPSVFRNRSHADRECKLPESRTNCTRDMATNTPRSSTQRGPRPRSCQTPSNSCVLVSPSCQAIWFFGSPFKAPYTWPAGLHAGGLHDSESPVVPWGATHARLQADTISRQIGFLQPDFGA